MRQGALPLDPTTIAVTFSLALKKLRFSSAVCLVPYIRLIVIAAGIIGFIWVS
ncbi:MAG: hypothetical protein LBU73_00925 [Helicobacteraceae bacterium]|nr:hypothetical protein [Helicobacteraceae bacterium]